MPSPRALSLTLAAGALLAGLVPSVQPAAARPSAPRATAPVTVATPLAATEEKRCEVWWSDLRLWCSHRPGAYGYEHRTYGSAARGQLYGTYGWFACWGRGQQHSGGNDVWYWTQLDNGQWGNVPAVSVYTTQDPPPGLKQC
ncbi:hypothetical protein ACFY7C_00900 [Streptomyces sp. NPDC012769]|uniref:hypothetical protein n=1 Tax=Streptomyces sp. NPDC012769 TaxID=3364848 RepID=UPI0036C4639E